MEKWQFSRNAGLGLKYNPLTKYALTLAFRGAIYYVLLVPSLVTVFTFKIGFFYNKCPLLWAICFVIQNIYDLY